MATCIVCDTDIKTSDGYVSRGLDFTSLGGFGTAVFDPMDGSRLRVYVCDRCLVAKQASCSVLRDESPAPVITETPFAIKPDVLRD